MYLALVTAGPAMSAMPVGRGRDSKARLAQQATERWRELYGDLIAHQLDPYLSYTLVRIGQAEFAFSSYDSLARGLRQAWDLGLAPNAHATVTGAELPEQVRRLDGVDPDAEALGASELARRRRFSRN